MRVLSLSSDPAIVNPQSEVAQRMIEYGRLVEELHIIVFTRHNADDADSMPMMRIADTTFVYPTNSRSRWFYIFDAVRMGKKILGGLTSTWRLNLQVEEWLVTSQDPFEIGLVGWRLKQKFGLPLQLQVHTDLFSPYFARQSFLNRLRVWVARFLIPRADCIRVVSERIKDSLDFRFPTKDLRVTVLPIFIDIERIKSIPVTIDLHKKYPQYEKIVLMASRLTKEKNIGLAIEAIREVVKEHPKTLLLIVGDGPEREKLKANIVFEPAVPFETLISYYKTADLYLLTSNYEGYGRTLVEAAAAGSPIVTTDVGVAGELEGARLVPVGDAPRLEQAITESITKSPHMPRLPALSSRKEYFELMRELWETCAKE